MKEKKTHGEIDERPDGLSRAKAAALLGECAGELPVDVQTRGNGDEPYWPQMNNATHKEVWTTPADRWLAVVAELLD